MIVFGVNIVYQQRYWLRPSDINLILEYVSSDMTMLNHKYSMLFLEQEITLTLIFSQNNPFLLVKFQICILHVIHSWYITLENFRIARVHPRFMLLGAPEFNPGSCCSERQSSPPVHVARSLVFCIMFCRSLFVLLIILLSFRHCGICFSFCMLFAVCGVTLENLI